MALLRTATDKALIPENSSAQNGSQMVDSSAGKGKGLSWEDLENISLARSAVAVCSDPATGYGIFRLPALPGLDPPLRRISVCSTKPPRQTATARTVSWSSLDEDSSDDERSILTRQRGQGSNAQATALEGSGFFGLGNGQYFFQLDKRCDQN